jgi:uncharacterized protein YxeA
MKVNNIIILSIIIIVIVVIIASVLFFVSQDNDSDEDDPIFTIEYANLEYDGEQFKFEYEYIYKNFKEYGGTIEILIKLIQNGEVIGTQEYDAEIDRRGSGSGTFYFHFESQATSVEKYRVEAYWNNKLIASVEKDFLL